MTATVGVIGDIHGNAAALAGMLQLVRGRFETLVFAGDYVDRGPESSSVLEMLIEYQESGDRTVFVAGNHDIGFLECLEYGDLAGFLRIGGAATIKSYVPEPQGDVLTQLRRAVPPAHLRFLRALRESYEVPGRLVVTHGPGGRRRGADQGFHVFGHVPQMTLRPAMASNAAAIDTGCGTLPEGRLTCLMWPTLSFVQVDSRGTSVEDAGSEFNDG